MRIAIVLVLAALPAASQDANREPGPAERLFLETQTALDSARSLSFSYRRSGKAVGTMKGSLRIRFNTDLPNPRPDPLGLEFTCACKTPDGTSESSRTAPFMARERFSGLARLLLRDGMPGVEVACDLDVVGTPSAVSAFGDVAEETIRDEACRRINFIATRAASDKSETSTVTLWLSSKTGWPVRRRSVETRDGGSETIEDYSNFKVEGAGTPTLPGKGK